MPFSVELWGLIIGFIFLAAVLSVWFTDSVRNARSNDRRMALRGKLKRRKMAYVRLTMDSFIEKGLFFCSAGVEQDNSTSLPNKTLLFGFGFFILITVSVRISSFSCSLLCFPYQCIFFQSCLWAITGVCCKSSSFSDQEFG